MKLPAAIAATLAAALLAGAGPAGAQSTDQSSDQATEGAEGGASGMVPADDATVEGKVAPSGETMAVPESAPDKRYDKSVVDDVNKSLSDAERDIKRSEEVEKEMMKE